MVILLRNRSRLVLAMLSVAWLGTTLRAGDIRADRPDSSYLTLATQPQFNGIGRVDFFDPSAGSLIAPNWVLTAGHLANASTVKFGNGGADDKVYNVLQNIAAPGWTGNVINGHDFRLLQIDGNPVADGKASVIFPIYQGPILDQVITNVGYGATGNGVTGYNPSSFGTRRAGNMVPRAYFIPGNNAVDASSITRSFTTTIMVADFIDPSTNVSRLLSFINGTPTTAAAQDLEYMLAPRDSGSPALINDNGVWKIAGVASFIDTQNGDGSGQPQGIYGDFSGFSVIDADTYNWIQSTIAAVPEPTSVALIGMVLCGGAGAGVYRYRRERRGKERGI